MTQFRARCLELIRSVESGGESVDIKRHGKVVARLAPPPATLQRSRKPWERLHGSGELLAAPEESVLNAWLTEKLGGRQGITKKRSARKRSAGRSR